MPRYALTALSAFAVIIGLLTLTFCSNAFAADVDVRAWFKSLTRPGTELSCCDISDCREVDAKWERGGWRALLPSGHWIAVPDSKVLKYKPNIMERAVICTSPAEMIYCFVPPDSGS